MSEDCERKIFQLKDNLITESYNKTIEKGKENIISSSLTSSLSLYKER